ncbi:MAG: MiaB/RimO family radical SAM methylthiotransferase [Patescibacteria group bacterium]
MEELNLTSIKKKTFLSVNFGCRVNAAETNLFSQYLINQGFIPTKTNPGIIFVNTCSITKKGANESIRKIKSLKKQYPRSFIVATGCAQVEKLDNFCNFIYFDNKTKEKLLNNLASSYTPNIKDKFTKSRRFILKIQSGCTNFCSYCIVPQRRSYLWSLPPKEAISTVNKAVANGYKELIITGINLNQYHYSFPNLIQKLLEHTSIELISFGSVPLNSIDDDFISLYKNPEFNPRLNNFLHIPLQSGSDKILKLMNRKYNRKKIDRIFSQLKTLPNLEFGTDIIVGFPGEDDSDFQETLNLCRHVGFKKIHTFRYSPRPGTLAAKLFIKNSKISPQVLKQRSRQIRASLI